MKVKNWMRYVLWIGGIYNLVWGGMVILFPNLLFDLAGMDHPLYPMIWQCLGMVIGVYGIGYLIAGFDPLRYWPIVLVGFLGKVFGPIGFIWYLWQGAFPLTFAWTILFNDLIWWIPFGWMLLLAYRSGEMHLRK